MIVRCSDCGVGQSLAEGITLADHGWRETDSGLVCEGCRPDYDPVKRLAALHATVDDLVGKLMYYDRKEDEALPRGAIDKLVADGHTSFEAIADRFRSELCK